MPTFEITSPDGRTFQVDGPEGSTKEQALEKVRSSLGKPAETPEATKAPPVTAGERTEATKGGVNRGIAGLLGMPVDTIENIINMGMAAYGAGTGKGGDAPQPIQGSFGGSQSIARGMEGLGINTKNPRPDDAASRMLNSAGVIAGGSVVPGAGVGRTAAAAAGGALAGEALGPEYAGVGAMLPGAATPAAGAAKNAIAARVAPRMADFEATGSKPSVGQATELNFVQGFENLLSKFPGGQGVFRKFVENQQETLAKNTATGGSSEKAGRAIEKGITGDGGFLDRTKATWLKLDDSVAQKIPKGSTFDPSNTVKALDDLTATTAGAEKTTGALVNTKIAQIKENLTADLQANNGQLPFEALRSLRSKVGSMLDDSLVSGVPNGELKKLYGGLSKDLEAAAKDAGAGQEFSRQSSYYKARMDRVEGVLNKVIGKDKTATQIFESFDPKNRDESAIVRATMRSLEPGERQVVTDAVVNRLGRASPGKQDAGGDVFSTETFLTNWNKMSDGAKAQLFPDSAHRNRMDSLANVAENLRDGAKVFANPSGTAGAAAPYGIGYAAAAGSAGTVGALIGGSYIGAKMLTSPKVVDWLAKSAKTTTPEQQTAQLARLGVIFNETKDEKLKAELGDYLKSISSQAPRQ